MSTRPFNPDNLGIRTDLGVHEGAASAAALSQIFEAIEAGEDDFVVVATMDDAEGQVYVQSAPSEGGYVVEHRDGSVERHFGTEVPTHLAAAALVSAWAFGGDDWDAGVAWERVTFDDVEWAEDDDEE